MTTLRAKIAIMAAVYIPTLLLAALGVFLAGPYVEERLFPVIDPATDRAANVRLVGSDLCWDSNFYKVRPGVPVRVSWTMIMTDRAGAMATYIGVAPRRTEGALAPAAPFVNLPPGEPHSVSWCVALPTIDFGEVRITADWEYRTNRWWTVHQGRSPVVYRAP